MTKKDTLPTISLTEMCNGSKAKMQYYGPNSLNEDGTYMPFSEQMAIISHYLHNEGTPYGKTYKKKALGLMEDIYKARCSSEADKVADFNEAQQYGLFNELYTVPFKPKKDANFTFIDLFAGMGGFRLAMQAQGGKCVFSSEWNKYAQQTYLANFGEVPFGDITLESTKSYIPQEFDILCAGFPCRVGYCPGIKGKGVAVRRYQRYQGGPGQKAEKI